MWGNTSYREIINKLVLESIVNVVGLILTGWHTIK